MNARFSGHRGGMFGLNDQGKQDETQMSQPDLVTKSNAALPDTVPPIAAGPIESAMPNYPLPGTNPNPPSAPVLPPGTDSMADHTQPIPSHPLNGSTEDEMLQMKQKALQSLAPLVGHLDQTPEEKFRTTMMLLQASDNHELVKEAYAAANAIQDEKARAQALLDVVNEINYFTQHKNGA